MSARRISAFLPATLLMALGWHSSRADGSDATCQTCHPAPVERLALSVHQSIGCQECHGGLRAYPIPPEDLERFTGRGRDSGLKFDHGEGFAGPPTRLEIPERCGECHEDVERMNPYGLRTDQLAQYRTSGHGKALFNRQDDKVAVCTDCHGPPHEILPAEEPNSRTHPINVPATCAACHEDEALMSQYELPVEVTAEYRASVHGRLLLEQHDTGAPTCATCHGNHSAMPPGFATVGAVCGQCHVHDAEYFATSIHAELEEHEGCVQCHGGGEGRHYHLIERITQPAGIMIERYAHLMATERDPTPARISEAIHPDARQIIAGALPTCTRCHEEIEEDEALPRLFALLDEIAEAERDYVRTANRLDEMSRGMLLVDNQRFKFQDAKTHLIELAPLQHALNNSLVREKVGQLKGVCDEVNADLDRLEGRLNLRRRLLAPIWVFAVAMAVAAYVKFKRLKAAYVETGRAESITSGDARVASRRSFLDWMLGLGSAAVGAMLAVPALLYLWPAARGGGAAKVEVAGAAGLVAGQSTMVQLNGKPLIVVRGGAGFRAFSAACTHLGCLVKWDPATSEFKCPCHAAVFDENGGVVSGPPPSPLPEYVVKEVGEKVYVTG